jgi:predicted MFS family arabinose efflux permease
MTVKTPDTSHVSLSPEVRVLVVARVVNSLGGFTLGFLPLLLVSAYDASLRSAGLVAASFGLATIPSRLLGGRLADVWDSRSVIVLGLAGCAVSQLALAAAPGIAGALAAAVVLGLCFEIYEPPSQALLADLTEPDQRPAAYAALGAALAGAGVVAGLIAAVVAGVGLRWLFVADAATCLACAALVWFRLPSVRPDRRPGAVRRSPWRDPRLRVMLGVGTGFAILYMTLMCGLPLAVHDDGLAAWWPGVLVAVSAATVIAAGRLPLTRRGDAFSRMRAGYALLALGLALAAGVALAGPRGWWYLVPVVVWSAGDRVLLGEPMAVVAGLAEAGDRARYLATYGLGWGIATTLAPALATGLLALGGPPALWLGCALGAAVLAGLQSPVRGAVTRK